MTVVASASPSSPPGARAAARPTPLHLRADALPTATRNLCALHTLERLAGAFNAAGVPLLALKGAALNLTLYRTPHARPMSDLDLLVRPADVPAAQRILGACGARRGAPLVREDFFPRFYYELEYLVGAVFPTRIDLHARPFRPLRYACTVPADAFWDAAVAAPVGAARIWLPSREDMLLHLAVHAAVHGCPAGKWQTDIAAWTAAHGTACDWDRLVARAVAWRLAWPLRRGLERSGANVPMDVWRALRAPRVTWRDRLALAHAPHDAAHPVRHVLVNALCTPDTRLVARYLAAVLLPDRAHMAGWYRRRHVGWFEWAHVLRTTAPVWRGVARLSKWLRGGRRRAIG